MDRADLINTDAKSSVLYAHFKTWCEDAGEKVVSQNIWARELKNLPCVTTGRDRSGSYYNIDLDIDGGEPMPSRSNIVVTLFDKMRAQAAL